MSKKANAFGDVRLQASTGLRAADLLESISARTPRGVGMQEHHTPGGKLLTPTKRGQAQGNCSRFRIYVSDGKLGVTPGSLIFLNGIGKGGLQTPIIPSIDGMRLNAAPPPAFDLTEKAAGKYSVILKYKTSEHCEDGEVTEVPESDESDEESFKIILLPESEDPELEDDDQAVLIGVADIGKNESGVFVKEIDQRLCSDFFHACCCDDSDSESWDDESGSGDDSDSESWDDPDPDPDPDPSDSSDSDSDPEPPLSDCCRNIDAKFTITRQDGGDCIDCPTMEGDMRNAWYAVNVTVHRNECGSQCKNWWAYLFVRPKEDVQPFYIARDIPGGGGMTQFERVRATDMFNDTFPLLTGDALGLHGVHTYSRMFLLQSASLECLDLTWGLAIQNGGFNEGQIGEDPNELEDPGCNGRCTYTKEVTIPRCCFGEECETTIITVVPDPEYDEW